MQVAGMEAGREFDSWIAETLFGLPRARPHCESCNDWGHGWTEQSGDWISLEHYTTDIRAAWRLVEKGVVESVIRLEDGRWLAVHAQNYMDYETLENTRFHCGAELQSYYEISTYEDSLRTGSGVADGPALAICRAAKAFANNYRGRIPLPALKFDDRTNKR